MKILVGIILLAGLLTSSNTPSVMLGSLAPEIELTNPEGKTIRLKDLRGKMVLIDFWASWCGPCRQESPNVVEAYNKYNKRKFKDAKGFEVFSVSLDRNEAAWKKAIADDKLTWKYHGWDKGNVASKAYGVRSIPSAFLVNGKGEVVASHNSLRGIMLHVEIEKHLK